MLTDSIIADNHPQDGREWDCQCARCGSSIMWEQCGACGELYESDPLWYDEDDYAPCHQCGGEAAYGICLSSPEWCEANPIKGRDHIKRGQIEWFTFDKLKDKICTTH